MSEFFPSGDLERHQIDCETYNIAEGPQDIVLADHRLSIVDVHRDLHEFDRLTDYAVIDPATYTPYGQYGYGELKDYEKVVIGRDTSANFELSDRVSRQHVSLEKRGKWVLVVDLESTNGTYVLQPRKKQVITQNTVEEINDTVHDFPDELDDIGDTVPDFLEYEIFKARAMAGFSEGSDYKGTNQDSMFVDKQSQSLGVFDGVGGDPGSERASQIATQAAQTVLNEMEVTLPRGLWHLAIQESLIHAHQAIMEENPRIATTATVAKMFTDRDGTPHVVIGSVGDSRAYLLRNGVLEHLTLDHAYGIPGLSESEARLVQTTLGEVTDLSTLSEEEREIFRHRNIITSHLGAMISPTMTISDFDVMNGDALLLTTDGIHDNLTDSEIHSIASQFIEFPEDLVRSLVKGAKIRSREQDHIRSKDDDMTAAVLIV